MEQNRSPTRHPETDEQDSGNDNNEGARVADAQPHSSNVHGSVQSDHTSQAAGYSAFNQSEEEFATARSDGEDTDGFHSLPNLQPGDGNLSDGSDVDEHVNNVELAEGLVVEEEVMVEEEVEINEDRENVEFDEAMDDNLHDNFVIVNWGNDESSSEESDGEAENNGGITYDLNVPTTHQYLGEDLQDVHGRVYYDEGSVVTLPVHLQYGLILMPGQTLPMHLREPSTVAMMRAAVSQGKTIALPHISTERSRLHPGTFTNYGTTAEILSINSESPDDPGSLLKAITRGRQRFKLLKIEQQLTGVRVAQVKILPEVKSVEPLEDIVPESVRRLRVRSNGVPSNGSNKQMKRVHDLTCRLTQWPYWVHSQYSPSQLMKRLKAEISKQWGRETFAGMERIKCADELAYWVADNIPMYEASKQRIISLDSSIQRLRYELHLIQRYTNLMCANCQQLIAKKADVFSLSLEGPMGTYVNTHGHVHETLTVHKAKNLHQYGTPTTEFSWFPGYAWTIVNCRRCGAHKGWKFTSSSLQPKSFYGLTRSALAPGLNREELGDNLDLSSFVI